MCDFHYLTASTSHAQESSQEACLLGITATVFSRGNMLKVWHSVCPYRHLNVYHFAAARVSELTSCEPKARLSASLAQ